MIADELREVLPNQCCQWVHGAARHHAWKCNVQNNFRHEKQQDGQIFSPDFTSHNALSHAGTALYVVFGSQSFQLREFPLSFIPFPKPFLNATMECLRENY